MKCYPFSIFLGITWFTDVVVLWYLSASASLSRVVMSPPLSLPSADWRYVMPRSVVPCIVLVALYAAIRDMDAAACMRCSWQRCGAFVRTLSRIRWSDIENVFVQSLDKGVSGIFVPAPPTINTPGDPFAYIGRKRLPCGKYNVYFVMFV